MSLTIGRASLATDPSAVTHDGDSLVFNVDINPGTLAEAKVLRQQLTGLTVGEVVPVTFSLDSDWDGFYQVAAPVAVAPITTYLTSGFMRAVVSLARLRGGFGSASVEFVQQTWDLVNDVDYTGSSPTRWLPAEASGVASPDTRTSATGTVYGGPAGSAAETYQVDVDSFYNGSAVVEFKMDSTWYEAVGLQVPAAAPIRIGNGLVRAAINATPADGFDLEVYNSATWESVATFDITNPTDMTPLSTRILRNDPEMIVVRWWWSVDAASAYTEFTDLSVVRGEMAIVIVGDIEVTADTAANPTEVTSGATDVGLVANAANADNHKWLMYAMGGTAQLNAGSANVELSGGATGYFGVHRDGASSPDAVADVTAECVERIAVRQRVIT